MAKFLIILTQAWRIVSPFLIMVRAWLMVGILFLFLPTIETNVDKFIELQKATNSSIKGFDLLPLFYLLVGLSFIIQEYFKGIMKTLKLRRNNE